MKVGQLFTQSFFFFGGGVYNITENGENCPSQLPKVMLSNVFSDQQPEVQKEVTD